MVRFHGGRDSGQLDGCAFRGEAHAGVPVPGQTAFAIASSAVVKARPNRLVDRVRQAVTRTFTGFVESAPQRGIEPSVDDLFVHRA